MNVLVVLSFTDTNGDTTVDEENDYLLFGWCLVMGHLVSVHILVYMNLLFVYKMDVRFQYTCLENRCRGFF